MIFLLEPLLLFVCHEELVELLPLELQLVLAVLPDGLLVRDLVILGLKERLETHHGWLESLQVLILGFPRRPVIVTRRRWSVMVVPLVIIKATSISSVILPTPSSPHPLGWRRHLVSPTSPLGRKASVSASKSPR